MANEPTPRNALALLVTCVVLTAALPHVPIVHWAWWPLSLLSTLAHELGHGVAALLVGGHFDRLAVYADGSGVAATATSGGRIARAVVAAGGLVGPAVAAGGMFLLARTQRHARVALAVTAGLLLLALLLVVRNLFGIAFVLVVAAALSAIVYRGQGWVPRFTLVFLAVQLALSVFSRSDYLFASVARTGTGPMPSDVAQMASALFLPFWFWGAACGALSLAVLLLGVRTYLAPLRTR